MHTHVPEEDPPKTPPAWVAVAALLLLFAAYAWARNGDATPTQSLWATGAAMGLGLLVIVGYVEMIFHKMLGFKSAIWAVAAAFAIVGYSCHADAARDVNAIFHVDAGALPMTVVAGTALRMFRFFQWWMLAACGVSLLILASFFFDKPDDDQILRVSRFSTAVASTLFSGLAFLVAHYQLSDEMLRPKLYRIAHNTDFSSAYECVGHDPAQFDALFIGPDQRRALFAPVLNDADLDEAITRRPPVLLPVDIPVAFQVADCVQPAWPRPRKDQEAR
jgi:hypothetical protein